LYGISITKPLPSTIMCCIYSKGKSNKRPTSPLSYVNGLDGQHLVAPHHQCALVRCGYVSTGIRLVILFIAVDDDLIVRLGLRLWVKLPSTSQSDLTIRLRTSIGRLISDNKVSQACALAKFVMNRDYTEWSGSSSSKAKPKNKGHADCD
jgi:hypothetical protein